MTEDQVIAWMKETSDDTVNYEITGLGFALYDIAEFGFDHWLNMSPVTVTDSFLETTYDVSDNLLSEFRTIVNQEQMLDELGIEQSMKLDKSGLIEALNKGLLDIMRSLQHYFFLQNEAKFIYNEHEN